MNMLSKLQLLFVLLGVIALATANEQVDRDLEMGGVKEKKILTTNKPPEKTKPEKKKLVVGSEEWKNRATKVKQLRAKVGKLKLDHCGNDKKNKTTRICRKVMKCCRHNCLEDETAADNVGLCGKCGDVDEDSIDLLLKRMGY